MGIVSKCSNTEHLLLGYRHRPQTDGHNFGGISCFSASNCCYLWKPDVNALLCLPLPGSGQSDVPDDNGESKSYTQVHFNEADDWWSHPKTHRSSQQQQQQDVLLEKQGLLSYRQLVTSDVWDNTSALHLCCNSSQLHPFTGVPAPNMSIYRHCMDTGDLYWGGVSSHGPSWKMGHIRLECQRFLKLCSQSW